MNDCIYLDNNATTKIDDNVLAAMLPYLSIYYGNPSSMHTFGGQVGRAVRQARTQVASLLGAEDLHATLATDGKSCDNLREVKGAPLRTSPPRIR